MRSVPNRWERASGAKSVGGPGLPAHAGIAPDVLSAKIDQFLGARGFAPNSAGPAPSPAAAPSPASAVTAPADFVCEDDVRQAIRKGETIVLGERAIVTPSARELGEQHRVFRTAQFNG